MVILQVVLSLLQQHEIEEFPVMKSATSNYCQDHFLPADWARYMGEPLTRIYKDFPPLGCH